VVHVHFESELELGAHAIHAGDEDGIEILGLIHRKQPAVTADLAEHTLGESFVREILDALFGAVGLVDVDARIGVGDRFGRFIRHWFRLLVTRNSGLAYFVLLRALGGECCQFRRPLVSAEQQKINSLRATDFSTHGLEEMPPLVRS
jgi:hypothetical protein